MSRRVLTTFCWFTQWILVFLVPAVLSHPSFLSHKRSRNLGQSLPAVWKDALQIERLKENILNSLNITKPPFITPRTLPIKRRRILKGDPSDHFGTLERMKNVSIILSEATEPYRKDTMVFKIHSKIRSHLSEIDNPLIILKLRLSSKSKRHSSTKEKKSPERKTSDDVICSSTTSEDAPVGNSTEKVESKNSRKNCIEKSKRRRSKNAIKLRRLQRKEKRLRRKKPRKIRIIVRLVDPTTNKRRRIFVEKMVLRKSKVFTVPVPKKLFRHSAESPNHTLTVQIACRNCKRYVKMDRVYRKGGRKQRNSRSSLRLNPNRPYLYIKTSALSRSRTSVISRERSKRQLNSNACIGENDTGLECCEKWTYISFEQLGLSDTIVYPEGFNTVDCIGVCTNTNKAILEQSSPFRDIHGSLASGGSNHQQCISTARSHLNVLYFADSNTIIPGRLVDFVGNSCSCAPA